jgi:hypothetical protein
MPRYCCRLASVLLLLLLLLRLLLPVQVVGSCRLLSRRQTGPAALTCHHWLTTTCESTASMHARQLLLQLLQQALQPATAAAALAAVKAACVMHLQRALSQKTAAQQRRWQLARRTLQDAVRTSCWWHLALWQQVQTGLADAGCLVDSRNAQ